MQSFYSLLRFLCNVRDAAIGGKLAAICSINIIFKKRKKLCVLQSFLNVITSCFTDVGVCNTLTSVFVLKEAVVVLAFS